MKLPANAIHRARRLSSPRLEARRAPTWFDYSRSRRPLCDVAAPLAPPHCYPHHSLTSPLIPSSPIPPLGDSLSRLGSQPKLGYQALKEGEWASEWERERERIASVFFFCYRFLWIVSLDPEETKWTNEVVPRVSFWPFSRDVVYVAVKRRN